MRPGKTSLRFFQSSKRTGFTKAGTGEDKFFITSQVAECSSTLERTVCAYTDALVWERGPVHEFVQKELSCVLILELTYIVCVDTIYAVMSHALRPEYYDGDDRLGVEPAPGGKAGLVATFNEMPPTRGAGNRRN